MRRTIAHLLHQIANRLAPTPTTHTVHITALSSTFSLDQVRRQLGKDGT